MSNTSLMSQFKRNNTTEYKSGYTLKNTTHIVKVVQSIQMFSDLKESILNAKTSKDEHLKTELNKLKNKLNDNQLKLAYQLMWLESKNRQNLINIINEKVINSSSIEKEMESMINSKEQALNIATSLGIIDDYCNYLESSIYQGPTDNI